MFNNAMFKWFWSIFSLGAPRKTQEWSWNLVHMAYRAPLFFETDFIWITLFLNPKMDFISSIIVFGFLGIQRNNVALDDKPYQDIF